jgi:quinol monooxygenase YgiN
MLHVIAVIKAKPGKRQEILSHMLANVPTVRAEDGCIEYVPAIDVDYPGIPNSFGPDTFLVIEKWSGPDALKAHAAAPHMTQYAAKTADLIEERLVYVLNPLI